MIGYARVCTEGWAQRSDDRGVANLGHHARHHVIEIVAVKCPAAGIVGVKGDGDAAHRRHQDGISHGTCEWGHSERPVAFDPKQTPPQQRKRGKKRSLNGSS